MTHTIHPKMLEKVASAISRELYGRVTYIAGEAATTERLKGVAQAAILAMWEGLPIEDAPKDGSRIDVLLNTGRRIPNVVSDGTLYRGKLVGPYLPLYNEDNEIVVSFIPIPTQETE